MDDDAANQWGNERYVLETNGSGTTSWASVPGGVSSVSGDGALITNSGSAGAVTLTLGNAAAYSVWGNNTSSITAPTYTNSPKLSGPITDIQSIGATSTDGVVLTDTTAATSGNQSWSPRLRWTGQGWKTNATAGSQEVDAVAEIQPVQGTANPNFNWVLSGQINNGGYAPLLTVPSSGGLNLSSGVYEINGTQLAASNLLNGVTGSGSIVLSISPTLTTPDIGAATGTSLAVTGNITTSGGDVGIGTSSPINSLDVAGGVAIGTSYAGVDTAPTNGLIVQGNVGIGTSSPGYILDVSGEPRFSSSSDTIEVNNSASSNSGTGIRIDRANVGNGEFFVVNGSNVGSIAFTTTVTSYNTTSDRRLKENIKPSGKGLNDLMKIEVEDYNFISDGKKLVHQGVIAQDLYKVYPDAVTVGGNDPKMQPWAVDYGRITPLLIRSIQQQEDEIAELKKAVDRLSKDK